MTATTKTFLDDAYAQAYPETLPFWQASAQGRLLVKACCHCRQAHWYPRVICPFCGHEETEWLQAAGTGTLYSFSIVQRTETPYVVAYVRLTEGPVLMTNMVDCEFGQLRMEQPVEVRFVQAPEGRFMPVFVPVAEAPPG